MINIYLVRHGRQKSPLCNVDVELSPEGRHQAELLRDRLKNYDIDAIYSSNLIRARQTAEIINQVFMLPHEIRDDIREISFGLMEGQSDEYIEERFHDFKVEQKKLLCDIPYPGGENGTDVCDRAMPILREISRSGKKNIVVVTHGGVIRSILAALIGKNQAQRFLFAVSLENTGITQLIYHPQEDRYYLERFNDYAHLEAYPHLHRSHFK